jgi:hypothetical protein
MTPYQFGVKVAAELGTNGAAPLPHAYSSMSTGNSTGVPPGGWTGKIRVPINISGTGGRNRPGVKPNVAEAANRAAGNASFPSNDNFGPTFILGPAPLDGNVETDPHSASRNIRSVGEAAMAGKPQPNLTEFNLNHWMPSLQSRSPTAATNPQRTVSTNAPAAAQSRTAPEVTTSMDGGTYSQQVGPGRQPVPGTGAFRAPGRNERIPDSALPPVPKLQPTRSPYGE